MRWWPWPRRRGRHEARNGHEAARQAKADAQRRLCETREQWPAVFEARDVLADLVERAMRGGRP